MFDCSKTSWPQNYISNVEKPLDIKKTSPQPRWVCWGNHQRAEREHTRAWRYIKQIDKMLERRWNMKFLPSYLLRIHPSTNVVHGLKYSHRNLLIHQYFSCVCTVLLICPGTYRFCEYNSRPRLRRYADQPLILKRIVWAISKKRRVSADGAAEWSQCGLKVVIFCVHFWASLLEAGLPGRVF